MNHPERLHANGSSRTPTLGEEVDFDPIPGVDAPGGNLDAGPVEGDSAGGEEIAGSDPGQDSASIPKESIQTEAFILRAGDQDKG